MNSSILLIFFSNFKNGCIGMLSNYRPEELAQEHYYINSSCADPDSFVGRMGKGLEKFRQLFFINHHILQREKGVHTNILSGPPLVCQQNATKKPMLRYPHNASLLENAIDTLMAYM